MITTNTARQLLSPEWKRNKRPVQSPNYKTGFFILCRPQNPSSSHTRTGMMKESKETVQFFYARSYPPSHKIPLVQHDAGSVAQIWIARRFLFLVDPTELSNWPVTASRTGVLYRNIYCALCHGVLDVDELVLPPGIRLDSSNLVDFWWMTVRCNNKTSEEFVANFEQFTFSRLTTLLSSRLILLC